MTKIFFQTHGCSTNFSETEVMKGIMVKSGFEMARTKDKADIIVINVCTVKGENTSLKEVRKIFSEFPDKIVIVSGCITPKLLSEVKKISENISTISTHNIQRVREVIEEILNGETVDFVAEDFKDTKICLPKVRNSPIVGIVPISSGCDLTCSYCSVRLIKGKLQSYSEKEILSEVNNCLKDGCKEIWITSQDNASYKPSIVELLKKIFIIPKDFILRVGMMNPMHVEPIMQGLSEVFKNDKIFKFLHAPVQSGNDDILEKMNRNYHVERFKSIVKWFREEVPGITVSTDIIVGFPGETDKQFQDSVKLIKEIKPDVLNLSKFVSREGTAANEMEKVDGAKVAERSRIMTDVFNNIARMQNERWIDWKGEILIDEKGKDDSWIGRNFAYKPVIVHGNFRLGQKVRVKVENVTSYDLRAYIISSKNTI